MKKIWTVTAISVLIISMSVLGEVWGAGADIFNWTQQAEATQYNKDQNVLRMEREDNSVQRRVADLKAAGLSPVLAAGQGASSSTSSAITAPQFNFNNMQARSAMMQQSANIAQSKAQKDLIDQKIQTEKSTRDVIDWNQRIARFSGTRNQPSSQLEQGINALGSFLQGKSTAGNAVADTLGSLWDHFKLPTKVDRPKTYKQPHESTIPLGTGGGSGGGGSDGNHSNTNTGGGNSW